MTVTGNKNWRHSAAGPSSARLNSRTAQAWLSRRRATQVQLATHMSSKGNWGRDQPALAHALPSPGEWVPSSRSSSPVALSQSPTLAAREPMATRQWLSLDLYHLSRTFPVLARTIETPINPGLQLGYHDALFGRAFRGGFSVQSAFHSFDRSPPLTHFSY
jgi:hypothetical protein